MEWIAETFSVSASEPFYRLVVVIVLIIIASLLYQVREEIKQAKDLALYEVQRLPEDEQVPSQASKVLKVSRRDLARRVCNATEHPAENCAGNGCDEAPPVS